MPASDADAEGFVGLEDERVSVRAGAIPALPSPAGPQAGERKHVTIVFADLSGFTALSEMEDPETVRDLVNACFARMGEAVDRFGGYIDKFIGDEMMVLFGAPKAIEDHASRALHAAVKMIEDIETFNRVHALAHPLTIHIGINSGDVVAGEMGTAGRRQYTVMGDAVNVAARLRSMATAGDVLVGADTRRLVGSGFQFAPLGPHSVGGRNRPVDIYRLTGAQSRAAAARESLEVPMLGRGAQLAVLQRAFRETASARGARFVPVTGAAGIGKSRLLAEFQAWLRHDGGPQVLLHGVALPHLAATPYFLAGEVVRHFLNVHESDSADAIRARLAAALGRAGLERPDTVDALLTLMGQEPESGVLGELTPRARKARMFEECTALVQHIASTATVVLVYEDTHWADDLSVELLRHLAAELGAYPVLFITLSRPSRGPAAAELLRAFPAGRTVAVDLAELDSKTSRDLVLTLAPALEGWPDTVETVVARGQGNPFFLQSIVASLLDRGLGALGGDAGPTPGRGAIAVPATIWGVLAERIDHLPPREKRVLQAGSIVGRVFWEDLAIGLAAETSSEPLHGLRDKDFIDNHGLQSIVGDREWAFRHVLVQEVAYSGLLREARHAGHLAAAAWIERRSGARRDEYAMLLAHHYSQAEDWEQAAFYYEKGGDRAAAIYANQEARDAYLQALAALTRLGPSPERDRRTIDVTLSLARAVYYAPYQAAWTALQAAADVAAALEDAERQFRVKTAKAVWLYMAGRELEAVELAAQCLAHAGQPEFERLMVGPYRIMGMAMFVLGNYPSSVAMHERSIEIEVRFPEHAWDGSRWTQPASARSYMGDWEASRALHDLALKEAQERGLPAEVANVHLMMAGVDIITGRYLDGAHHAENAIAMSVESDNRTTLFIAEGLLGGWLEQAGDFPAARQHLERGLAIAREMGTAIIVPLLEAFFAQLEMREGKLEAAVARVQRAIEEAKATNQVSIEGETHRIAGWCRHYLHPDAPEAAEAEFRTAVELQRLCGAQTMVARSLFDLAAMLDMRGDAAAAGVARAEAETIAERCGLSWMPVPPPQPGSLASARSLPV